MGDDNENEDYCFCSFCGAMKWEGKWEVLVKGPDVGICDECLVIANRVMTEELQKNLKAEKEKRKSKIKED